MRITVRLEDDLHSEARAKADCEVRALNGVIVRLLEKWVAGEVDLKPPIKECDQEGK